MNVLSGRNRIDKPDRCPCKCYTEEDECHDKNDSANECVSVDRDAVNRLPALSLSSNLIPADGDQIPAQPSSKLASERKKGHCSK
jgi:hypothetical protein